jgi:hypothetical protein
MIVDSLKKIPNGWIICYDYPACLLILGVFINWLEDGRRKKPQFQNSTNPLGFNS